MLEYFHRVEAKLICGYLLTEIYKSLRYKPDKPEKRKKKRIRVLNYEPFPKYTESSGKSSAKSEGNWHLLINFSSPTFFRTIQNSKSNRVKIKK